MIFKYKAQPFLYGFFVFLASLFFYPYYQSGDQYHYRGFYDIVHSYDLVSAYSLYKASLGSSEPVYFGIVYFLGGVIPKDLLFSAANGLLVFFSVRWLVIKNVNPFVIVSLLPNFYLLVLFFAAERLKISFLFFSIGVFFYGCKRHSFWVVAIFAHTQIALLVVTAYAEKASKFMTRIYAGWLNIRVALSLLAIIATMLFVGVIMKEHIAYKILYYSSSGGGLESLIKPAVFYGLTLLYSKNERLEASLAFVPIFLAIYFIGADRLVIFSYMIFLYYALRTRRGVSLPVALTSFYFLVQGGVFMYNVVKYGNGFPV